MLLGETLARGDDVTLGSDDCDLTGFGCQVKASAAGQLKDLR